MNSIYRAMRTSKQNVHQRMCNQIKRMEMESQLQLIVQQIRTDHPGMGVKALYQKIRPECGRDAFYDWYRNEGLKVRPHKNWRRTTDSSGVIRFDNLTEGLQLTGVNQLWVSDITYYEISNVFYYLTYIMDQYSRKIKGYSTSFTLKTHHTTIPALRMAMKALPASGKTIFHSDGGGQYYCHDFLKLTSERFLNSMGKSAYENPHAERLNRTMKNSYLKRYNPQSYNQLKIMNAKAVSMYNDQKPHASIYNLTPSQFEQNILLQSIN